jgi:hypothetical protein
LLDNACFSQFIAKLFALVLDQPRDRFAPDATV